MAATKTVKRPDRTGSEAAGQFVTGLQLVASGLLAIAKKASFQLAFGSLALGITLKAFVAAQPTLADYMICISTFCIGALVGTILDDFYTAWRDRQRHARERQQVEDDGRMAAEQLKVKKIRIEIDDLAAKEPEPEEHEEHSAGQPAQHVALAGN